MQPTKCFFVLLILSVTFTHCKCSDELPSDEPVDGGDGDMDVDADGDSDADADGDGDTDVDGEADADICNSCPEDAICRYNTCVPDLGTCESYDDCPGDSYCSADGECLPYGVPPEVINDPECRRQEIPEEVTPAVQCSWDDETGPARIYSAPIVADLNLDLDPGRLQPSIVVTAWHSVSSVRTGWVRVFDGRTCQEQMHIGEQLADRPGYGTQLAVGDLDGDVPEGGHPEIVGMHTTGETATSPLALYALRIDSSVNPPVLERAWVGRDCETQQEVHIGSNQANFGPGIWDLDDDGSPEIVIDTVVFDSNGCVLSSDTFTPYISHGRLNAVADVDLDGEPELVAAEQIGRWDTATTEWEDEQWFVPGNQKPGHIAIADLGQYSEIPGHPIPNQLPEIIIVSAEDPNEFEPDSTGAIRVQALDGSVVFGPVDLYHETSPHGGHGGAPTASDFDGDGQVEFAAAANEFYVVYDPDCDASLGGESPAERPGGRCDRPEAMAGLPDGILWAQPSNDFSSSGTGSSVFDFNGDGRAEAVYGDECYARVYDGATGEVIFSASASSGTGFEFPTIADVDGDFATEVVVAKTVNSGCSSPDPLFPESGDFVSENGFVILRDPEDRWASSRPIWNQHAYSVTNVTDDAQIPRSSAMEVNWTTEGLNNFRQNVQGETGLLNIADLTVVFDSEDLCAGATGTQTLRARVCNRGTANVQDGVRVDFAEAESPEELPGTLVCTVSSTRLLTPGECEDVECAGDVTDSDNLYVLVDPDDEVADCHPGNNDGAGLAQVCVI